MGVWLRGHLLAGLCGASGCQDFLRAGPRGRLVASKGLAGLWRFFTLGVSVFCLWPALTQLCGGCLVGRWVRLCCLMGPPGIAGCVGGGGSACSLLVAREPPLAGVNTRSTTHRSPVLHQSVKHGGERSSSIELKQHNTHTAYCCSARS